jgi:hypothetical protein
MYILVIVQLVQIQCAILLILSLYHSCWSRGSGVLPSGSQRTLRFTSPLLIIFQLHSYSSMSAMGSNRSIASAKATSVSRVTKHRVIMRDGSLSRFDWLRGASSPSDNNNEGSRRETKRTRRFGLAKHPPSILR